MIDMVSTLFTTSCVYVPRTRQMWLRLYERAHAECMKHKGEVKLGLSSWRPRRRPALGLREGLRRMTKDHAYMYLLYYSACQLFTSSFTILNMTDFDSHAGFSKDVGWIRNDPRPRSGLRHEHDMTNARIDYESRLSKRLPSHRRARSRGRSQALACCQRACRRSIESIKGLNSLRGTAICVRLTTEYFTLKSDRYSFTCPCAKGGLAVGAS